MNDDVAGAVFRTGKLWFGSIRGGQAAGNERPLRQAEVGTVCILPLLAAAACSAHSAWSNIRTMRSLAQFP